MSNHDNHDSHTDSSEKFIPLSDNNNNLALGKVIPLIISLALVIFGLVTIVTRVGGHLENEEQVEWRKEHHKPYKDSHENKIYYNDNSSETKGGTHEGTEKKEMKEEEHHSEGHKHE